MARYSRVGRVESDPSTGISAFFFGEKYFKTCPKVKYKIVFVNYSAIAQISGERDLTLQNSETNMTIVMTTCDSENKTP